MDPRATGRIALLSTLTLAACGGAAVPDFEGDRTYEYFPFDKVRTWTYESDDTSLPYRLQATQDPEFVNLDDGTQIHTIDFLYDCFGTSGICEADTDGDDVPDVEGTVAFSWSMSSGSRNGVQFHSFDDTEYDPGVLLGQARMTFKSSVTTETGGVTWTSTYDAFELCPAESYWPIESSRPDCMKLVLEDGDGEGAVAGTYWAAPTIGITAMILDGADEGRFWSLKNFRAQEFSEF